MKRFLALFLTIIMLLSLFASCKPNDDPQETTPEATTPEATTPESTTPGETTPDDGDDPIVPPTEKMAAEIVEALNPAQLFEATFGCQEAIFEDVASRDTILDAFKAEGYTQLDVDMVEGAKFETILLTKAEELVTLYWIASEKEVRVTWEKVDQDALAVLQKNASTGGGTLTMVQIGVERVGEKDNPNIGLCYVFKLSNGNAIVIDGGFNNELCAENIYKALAKLDINKNDDDKYVIEAWIFTHGHGDHNGVMYAFAEYADKVDVSYILYQLPANEALSVEVGQVSVAGEADFHATVQATFPNATIINPHVGLNYYFGNATVSMLYTPDVLWTPESKLDYYNNTSLIFKVSGGDTGFLCMGDAGDIAAQKSWSLFDAIAYESGVLQITHHGMSTGANGSHAWDNIKKIYEATGATTVALPLGTRIEDNTNMKASNGRWIILFSYPYNSNSQMSYIVRKGDSPNANGYFNQELFNRLIATAETGHNYLAEMSSSFKNVKTLHGYNGINMIDNGAGIITYISCADKTEMATEFLFAKGGVTVKKNEKLDDWIKLPEFNAIDVVTLIDANAQIFESTFGTQEVVLKNVTDKESIVSAFTARGFESVSVTPVAGAKFETLLFGNGMELVTVYWKPAENEARILFEKIDDNVLSALVPNATTGTGELTMVQVGVERGIGDTGNPMIGMCYVIKLSDGRAIVIDGGFNYESNADNVYNALSKLDIARNEDGQYIIAAWFFSHGDGDHVGIMETFGKKYSEKTDVTYIIYNLPSASQLLTPTSATGEAAFYNNCKAAYPNAVHLIPRAGVQYFFGNATIDMLYTPDLVWSPESKITYYNSTSIVYMINGGGATFLSTGDAGESAFREMWNHYESSSFKCDVFQVPHHGLTTQNTEDGTGNYAAHGWTYIKKVYDATGAKYAVLPMGDRNPKDSRNGRSTVIIFWGNANCAISYLMDKDDKAFGALSGENYQAFVDAVAAGTNTHQTYLGYNGINILNNGKGLTTYIASSETAPMATVFSFAKGNITVETNEKLHDWLAEPTLVDSFESTFDSDMEIYTNVKSSSIFVDQFVADGFALVDIDMIEGAKFETIILTKGNEQITMYWFASTGDLRIAYDTVQESALAPLTPNDETGKGEVIVAQIGVDVPESGNIASTENNPNIGLCYVFKLSNGRAIIIDGGWYYDSNADNLYNALEALDIAKDADGKYIIEAWIFTHGHGDHNGVTTPFFAKYGDKTDVKYFVYQLPSNSEISPTGAGYAGEEAFHELCKTAYPNATYLNPRSGVTYYFGNAAVDMLHTPDIIWSHSTPIPDYNDSGIIFKVYGGGVEGALFMGDSGEHPSIATVKNYDVSAFNSNIVQISHHGLNTQINEGHEWRNMKVIYEGATAEYAFLPMGVARPGGRSGRWSVLCAWGYTGKQASFVINADDDAAGVDMAAWDAFVAGILDGSIKDKTFLGYNGYNVIDNGQGRITYIHCSETAPMVTIMSFKDGNVTVELNEELYTWVEENT